VTIKEQIIRLLSKAQYPMTNREIAKKIKRPEPSVRRATAELDMAWMIVDTEWVSYPKRWQLDSGIIGVRASE
jgi:DNA-binding IclR family transcriptional regulator